MQNLISSMEKQPCKFQSLAGNNCGRFTFSFDQITTEPYCIFHYGYGQQTNTGSLDKPYFQEAFEKILASEDGNWEGFVFPVNFVFPTIKEISFPINARECKLFSLRLDTKITFKKSVDFSGSIFRASFILSNTVFKNTVRFSHCHFEDTVEFLSVLFEQPVNFDHADFAERTILRVDFSKNVTFNETVFRGVTVFTGWRSVTLTGSGSCQSSSTSMSVALTGGKDLTIKQQIRLGIQKAKKLYCQKRDQLLTSLSNQYKKFKKFLHNLRRKYAKTDPNVKVFRVFENESHFEGVIFLQPDKVLFSQLSLSKVRFRGTNLRGVRFLAVDWWQPILGRNGIYDELFISKSNDGAFRYSNLPVLEETCRNVRVALEENRSFNVASDFYIAEMEALRQQQSFFKRHFFSVAALYRFVSQYGTSVGTAIRILILFYLLHVASTLYIHFPIEFISIPNELATIALRSIKILLLFQPESQNTAITTTQSWLDVGLRLVGPIQIAMIAFAFRSRIKRH